MWRSVARLAGALLLAAVATACSEAPSTVPDEHADLVGTWRHGQPPSPHGSGPHVFALVTITRDAKLSYAWYESSEGGHTCAVLPGAPLTTIGEHELAASVLWPFSTELTIDRAPQRDGDRWTMTVDGVELERVSDEPRRPAARFACESGTLVQQDQGAGNDSEGGTSHEDAI